MTHSTTRSVHFFSGPILSHEQIAESTWQVGVECPELAARFIPGQFAMLRIANRQDALLGRAFAFWDRILDDSNRPVGVQFVYLVKGRLTRPLATLPVGSQLEIWGPLGNGFSNAPVDHLVLVAGGVGQTPMLTVAQEALGLQAFVEANRESGYAKQVTLIYGARSKEYLAGLPKFHAVPGLTIKLTTEDGSVGHRGRVTDELRKTLSMKRSDETMRVCCCGPEPMMEAVGEMAVQMKVPCEVSLETPMACGIGICFTCVAKIREADGTWDYRRTCMEGPVFDAEHVCW